MSKRSEVEVLQGGCEFGGVKCYNRANLHTHTKHRENARRMSGSRLWHFAAVALFATSAVDLGPLKRGASLHRRRSLHPGTSHRPRDTRGGGRLFYRGTASLPLQLNANRTACQYTAEETAVVNLVPRLRAASCVLCPVNHSQLIPRDPYPRRKNLRSLSVV